MTNPITFEESGPDAYSIIGTDGANREEIGSIVQDNDLKTPTKWTVSVGNDTFTASVMCDTKDRAFKMAEMQAVLLAYHVLVGDLCSGNAASAT